MRFFSPVAGARAPHGLSLAAKPTVQIRFGLNVQIDKQQCTATRTPGEEVERFGVTRDQGQAPATGTGRGSGGEHQTRRIESFSFSIQTFSGTDLKTPQRDAPRLLNLGSQ